MMPRIARRLRQLSKWLVPGIRVKRFILLQLFGVVLVVVGAVLMLDFAFPTVVAQVVGWFMRSAHWVWGVEWWILQPLGALTFLFGLVLMFLGLRATIRSVAGVFLPRGDYRLVELMVQRRAMGRGPRIVALGGGTGLSNLLRGLKRYTTHLTAVVTVFDDGGSSGRLRRELGVPPPGDINDCLIALAEAEPVMTDLFRYRFPSGDLSGHSFGNLFLASMTGVGGDLVSAVRLASRVLAIRGQVLPATNHNVVLSAEFLDGSIAEGESAIPKMRKAIRRVVLRPSEVRPVPEVLEAIANADLIVLGPGSLFTSVLPNLLVRGVAEAVRRAQAPVIQIVNVMTQPGETDGFRASDHIQALIEHIGPGLVDGVVVNTQMPRDEGLLTRYLEEGAVPVVADLDRIRQMGVEPFGQPLVRETDLVRHDPQLLADAVLLALDRLSQGRHRVSRISVINP